MARFQATTNAVLEAELRHLSEHLGLRPSQRAELLREMASLTSWVVHQMEAGRRVEARRGDQVEPLVHPLVHKLHPCPQISLSDSEVHRLAEILESGFAPTPELREALRRLADPSRTPPRLDWTTK